MMQSTTTATSSKPLPYDVQTLRAYWIPPEPENTTVTRARRALAELRSVVGVATIELDTAVAAESADVVALVDLAEAGDDIDTASYELGRRSSVPALRHRLELAQAAEALAADRLRAAETYEPDLVAWRAACLDIERSWRALESAEDRTGVLIDWVQRQTTTELAP